MARQMFTGNYGAPLAQVDTRPILAAGQAWGQAFQNLGQVASDVVEKHREKKQKEELKPQVIDTLAKMHPEWTLEELGMAAEATLKGDNLKTVAGLQQMQAQQQQMQAQKQQMDFFQTVKDFKAQQEENQANRLGLLNDLTKINVTNAEDQAKINALVEKNYSAAERALHKKRLDDAQVKALEQANQLNARKMLIQNKIDKAVDPVEVAKLEQELLELNRDQALANITGTKARTEATIAGTDATKAQTKAVELETKTKKEELELYPLAEQIKLKKDKDKAALGYTKAMTEGATATTAEKKRIAEVRKARNFVQVDSNGNVSVKQGGKNIAPDILEDAIFEKEKRWHEMRLKKLQQEGIQATTKGKQVYANYQNWLMTEGNARKVPTTEFERHLQTIPKSEWPALIRARMQYMTEKGKGPEDQLKLLGVMEAAPTIPVALAARQYRRAMSGDEQETLTAKIVDEKTEGIYKGIGGKKTGRKVLKFKAATDTNETEWVEVPLTELMIQDLKRYNKLEDEVLGRTPADETPTPKPTPTPTQFNKEEAISNMRNYFNQ